MISKVMAKYFLLTIFISVYPLSNQQRNLCFESSIRLTPIGSKFQPKDSIELLGTLSNTPSIMQCAINCNQNRQCRTFDYDQSSLICRLFEGEFSTGSTLSDSISLRSTIGAIIYDVTVTPQLYTSYNQTCDQCSTDRNRYLECINNTCQCPVHTYWSGQMCLNQLYNGSNCSSSIASCRQDLNLTCSNQTNSCIASHTVPGV